MYRARLADRRYKQEAIERIGRAFLRMWKWSEIVEKHWVILIPTPRSKARGHPLYDARMNEVFLATGRNLGVQADIRDCLRFSGHYSTSDETGVRPTREQL
jgi:hypothetical protein